MPHAEDDDAGHDTGNADYLCAWVAAAPINAGPAMRMDSTGQVSGEAMTSIHE